MAHEFDSRVIPVTTDFFKALKVDFTKTTLKRRLEENSYYPSLYSISQVLNWYNIENRGLKVAEDQLQELPLPFLAHIDIKEAGSKDFVNVTGITDTSVTFYDGKEHTVSKAEFLEKWSSNIVLLAEKNDQSGEKNYDKNQRAEKKNVNKKVFLLLGFAVIFLAGLFNYFISSPNVLASATILLFSILGLSISVLLLVYDVDKANAFVKNICTGGVKTNCDAVLGSKAAKIFGISWGEIGFFYFGFIFLFLLIPTTYFHERIPYLSYISILSSMYIPFSLIYQYKVVRQWCRLCLAIQGVLFLNLLWVLQFGSFSIDFNESNITIFLGCLLFPILLWYALKPIIIKAKNADKFLASYKRLTTRLDIFNLTLENQPKILDGWEELGGIVKGNPNAENVIFKICSPACKHCEDAHRIFNEIINANDNVKLITIYYVTNDADDDRRFPVKHFLGLSEQGDKKSVEEAMDYWYLNSDRTYHTLMQKYPLTENILENQAAKINAMNDWCKIADIAYTPTIYLNGRQLPITFALADLKDIFK